MPLRFLRAALLGLAVATTTLTPAWAKPPAKGGKAQKSGQKAGDDSKKKGSKASSPPAKAAAAASPAPPAAKPVPAKAPETVAPPLEVKLTIQRATLDNGLRVVLNPDKSSPTVAI